ncbi:ABC transporter substrate-binding protein [Acholeplasma granularum]|uniref:ABC transporter substrate-binding protein n=1 Tax=Acholeplasma granularum TaxID=264635 RepID=UPI00046EB8A0|nr:ABC transporter substrate-binding protein [Acholeplasma granularum]
MRKITILTIVFINILFIVGCSQEASNNGFYTVEFFGPNQELITETEIYENELIDKPADPVYLNYEFVGWFTSTQHHTKWNFNIDKVNRHLKLYARFETKITHTISSQNGLDNEGNPVYIKENIEENIRVNPKVVVSFSLDIADIFMNIGMDKLNLMRFGIPKSNLPETLNMFDSNMYPNVGTLFEPNYDALDLILPELIIIGGRSSNLYDTLSQKYPNADILDVSNTIFSFETQNQVFTNLGNIFPQIKETLDNYLLEFNTRKETIKSLNHSKNALFVLLNNADISIFGAGSRYGVIYDEFGFTPSDPNLKTLESHGNIVSFEYISQVNPQTIFILDRAQAVESSGSINLFINNQLVKNTVAGKNSDIYVLEPFSWYILPGGITSTLQMLDDIEQVFK